MTVADELQKLARLRDEGALTPEEFEAQKAKLLAGEEKPGPEQPAEPRPKGRMSVLAIIAFAMSFIAGPIGSILGIVATISVARSRGRLKGLGFAIASMPIGMTIWGMLAAIAIPAFINYTRRAKSTEAMMNLDRMLDGAVTYYEVHQQYPPATDWTPVTPCCEQSPEGGRCDALANQAQWQAPGWRNVNFAPYTDFYFQYRLHQEGGQLYAQARGDLDCDGTFSLFERAAQATPEGLVGAPGIYKDMPLE